MRPEKFPSKTAGFRLAASLLDKKYRSEQKEPHHIRHKPRLNHQESADKHQKALKPMHRLHKAADHRRTQTDHANDRSQEHRDKTYGGRVDHQNDGREYEDVRDDESGDCQFRCVDARL